LVKVASIVSIISFVTSETALINVHGVLPNFVTEIRRIFETASFKSIVIVATIAKVFSFGVADFLAFAWTFVFRFQ
jgi:hypothetical protein